MSTTIVADSKSKTDARKKKREGEYVKTSLSVVTDPLFKQITKEQRKELIDQLRHEMREAAKDLEFERAAELRDEIDRLSD
jgi:excinuclease ABC subunit B